MFYTIYQTTNKLNGKFYVGKHKTNNLDDGYLGSGLLLWRAIFKYGPENFEKKILFFLNSEDEMNAKEKEIVNEEFVAREDTYNLKIGGEGGWDFINKLLTKEARSYNVKRTLTDEIRQKESKGASDYWKETNEEKLNEHKHKISLSLKELYKHKPHQWKGRKHKKETKEKISLARQKNPQLGKNNARFGMHWWKDPNDKTKSLAIKEGDPVPEGWIRGRWQIQTALKGHKIHKCRFCGAIKEKDQSNKTISTCKNKTLCWHFQPTKKLAKYFGFDKSSIGTERYYEEYHKAAKHFFAMWNSYGLSEVAKRINWENKSYAGLYSLYAALSKLFPEYKLLTID